MSKGTKASRVRNASAASPGWKTSLESPAVWWDEAEDHWYIHGGVARCPRKKINCALFEVDMSPLPSAQHSTAVISVLWPPQHNTDEETSLKESSNGGFEICDVAIYGHILLKYQRSIYVHGGCGGDGTYRNDLLLFHLDSKRWSSFHSCLGGCTPPRLYGHTVVQPRRDRGIFVVVGSRATLHQPPRKRRRSRSALRGLETPGREDTDDCDGLRVFLLNLEDPTLGWGSLPCTGVSPGPRCFFQLQVSTSSAPASSSDITGVELPTVLFMAGGREGETLYSDLWQLTLTDTSGCWREVRLLAPPSSYSIPQYRSLVYQQVSRRALTYRWYLLKSVALSASTSDTANVVGVTLLAVPSRHSASAGSGATEACVYMHQLCETRHVKNDPVSEKDEWMRSPIDSLRVSYTAVHSVAIPTRFPRSPLAVVLLVSPEGTSSLCCLDAIGKTKSVELNLIRAT